MVHGQNVGGQNTGGQNIKIAREDKMLSTFMAQGGQNADLIKRL